MNDKDKTREQLTIELQELQQKYDSLKEISDKGITKHKQVEKFLLESKENLFITLHSIGDGVISTDKNGLIVQMNPIAEKLCGWKLADAAGKPLIEVFKIINAETGESVADPVGKVLENGEIVGLANHTVLISKNGNEYQISDSAAPIKTKEGEITGVILVFSDVTESYAAQKQMNISAERYRSLLNNLEAGIVVHAPDTSIVMNNPRASELLGLTNDQMRGKVAIDPAWKFVNEDNIPLALEDYPVNRIVSTKQAIKNRILGIHQPGKNNIVWVTVNGFPALNKTGEITEIVISFIDITERKLTEQALQKLEAKQSSMISNISDVMGIIGLDGLMKYKSPNIEKWFGWQPQDLIGTDGWLTVHPNDLERIQKEFFTLLEKDNSVKTIEYLYKCKDGSYKPIELTATNLTNDPIINGVLLNYHDITERKKAEEKVREKDIQFRKLSANVSDLIFQLTRRPDGTYYVPIASEGIRNIFGCSPEDVLNDFTPIGKVIYPDDAVRVISDIEYSAKHLTYFTCEFRVQIPGKAIQWIYSKSNPEKLPDGSITWYGFNADITERKQAEELLNKSKEDFRRIIETSPDGIAIAAMDGTIQFVTAKVVSMWGYDSADELLGRNIMEFVHPDYHEKAISLITEMFNGNLTGVAEYLMVRKDGSLFYAEANANILRDVSNNPTGVLYIERDITERKKAEEALRRSEEMIISSQSVANICSYSTTLNENELEKSTWICSPEFYNIFGIDETYPHTIAGWVGFIHPDYRDKLAAYHEYVVKNKTSFHHQYKIIRINDGVERWVEGTGELEYDTQGNPIRMYGAIQDITKLKQNEESLIKLKTAIEKSKVSVIITDSKGNIEYANQF